MCQMGLLDMKRQIEVQVDLDCLGVGGHQSRQGWESNNVLGGAPGELGADVDQREGGDDGGWWWMMVDGRMGCWTFVAAWGWPPAVPEAERGLKYPRCSIGNHGWELSFRMHLKESEVGWVTLSPIAVSLGSYMDKAARRRIWRGKVFTQESPIMSQPCRGSWGLGLSKKYHNEMMLYIVMSDACSFPANFQISCHALLC